MNELSLSKTISAKLKNVSNKKLLVISDFDETLVNNYIFDEKEKNHIPILSKRMVNLINTFRQKNIPFVVGTARGKNDHVVNTIGQLTGNPVVLENGGLLLINNKFKCLLEKNEQKNIEEVKKIIEREKKTLESLFIEENLELVIRLNRETDIEFRIQDKNGKGRGREWKNKYLILENKIFNLIGKSRNFLKASFSGSTLTIITQKISKQYGFNELFKIMVWDKNDYFIVALGDSENDFEMLNFADWGINVGNNPNISGTDLFLGKGEEMSYTFLNLLIREYKNE